jgi:hypothetical protein
MVKIDKAKLLNVLSERYNIFIPINLYINKFNIEDLNEHLQYSLNPWLYKNKLERIKI